MRTNVDSDTDQSGTNEGVKAMETSEWLEETNKMHIHRADMNKLIMNYLVMGECVVVVVVVVKIGRSSFPRMFHSQIDCVRYCCCRIITSF